MSRFIVREGSISAHCCFDATVLDTTKPKMFGDKHYGDIIGLHYKSEVKPTDKFFVILDKPDVFLNDIENNFLGFTIYEKNNTGEEIIGNGSVNKQHQLTLNIHRLISFHNDAEMDSFMQCLSSIKTTMDVLVDNSVRKLTEIPRYPIGTKVKHPELGDLVLSEYNDNVIPYVLSFEYNTLRTTISIRSFDFLDELTFYYNDCAWCRLTTLECKDKWVGRLEGSLLAHKHLLGLIN